ncbi:MAG: hypothetical protein IT180_06260 [Acidobacteria bacterium]|nr:hypothetical protein [Acidobacteriota bacterium]
MNIGSLALWGFVATIVLTTLMAASRALGYSRMGMPFILGTMLTPNRDRAMAVGFVVHVINGWFLAVPYALAFESLGRATWWLGAAAGLLHGLFVLLVGLSIVPGLHPRMASEHHGPEPTRQLQPPGFLGLHYGRGTPLVTLAAHVVYGAILGGLYRLAGQ